MFDWFQAAPGRLYVVGTLLPLAAFALLLVAGGLRALCRPFRQQGGMAASVYWALGGDTPARGGAYLTTACMGLAAVIGFAGLVLFLNDHTTGAEHAARWGERTDWLRLGPLDSAAPPTWEKQREADPSRPTPPTALALELGYKIDHLTAVVFAMVTVVGTLIFTDTLNRTFTDLFADTTSDVVVVPTETVYEHGFDPLAGGFEVNVDPTKVFSQWIEVLATDQVAAVPATVEPDGYRRSSS